MKIFELGIDQTIINELQKGGFTVAKEQATTQEELIEIVTCLNFDAVAINFDAFPWNSHAAVKQLREKQATAAVIGIQSPNCQPWSDIRAGFLNAGGDDLLQAPVSPRELAATIHATVRRHNGSCQNIHRFQHGDAILSINVAEHSVFVNDISVRLTRMEMALLSTLAMHEQKVQSRDSLLENLYSAIDDEPEADVIDSLLCKVKRKLNQAHPGVADIIETVRGRGFRLTSTRMN